MLLQIIILQKAFLEDLKEVSPILIFTFIYLSFLTCWMLYTDKGVIRKEVDKKKFIDAVIIIIELYPGNIPKMIYHINLMFDKLIEEYPTYRKFYKSPAYLLEDFLYRIYTNKDNTKKKYKKVSQDKLDTIIQIIDQLKTEKPYSSLPEKDASLLTSIYNSIKNSNKELALISLLQLSVEIELKESNLLAQSEKSRKSTVLSVIGLILTITFGIISLKTFLF